jgi:hypothetical protein
VVFPLVYRAYTYSRRRTEGENVRGRGRRAYGATLDGKSMWTGFLKCLAEGGRRGRITIVTTVARSNHTSFLCLLQIFRTHCNRVGYARHGLAGTGVNGIIEGIAWNHRQWKIVTVLQRNGKRPASLFLPEIRTPLL